jgi:hypothetical protein
MLTPNNYFDLKDFGHQGIFSENEAVWTALDHLKDYMASFFKKSWPLSKTTGLIEKAFVIYDDEVRNDLEVRTSGPNDSIQVFMKGELLENAAVILPGAFLFNEKIIIGPGRLHRG